MISAPGSAARAFSAPTSQALAPAAEHVAKYSAAAAAEHVAEGAENVLDIVEALSGKALRATTTIESCVPELIVGAPLFLVAEDAIGLSAFLELALRFLVPAIAEETQLHTHPALYDDCQIVAAELGAEATVIGAALLAR